MHLRTRNVNTAFASLVELFSNGLTTDMRYAANVLKEPSRNGPVLRIDEPVLITYTHPKERVLFNSARDANPFFHLYEALWMLAGRNDVASVAYYAKQMAEYSDDGRTLNGAYGYRWRHAPGYVDTPTGGGVCTVDQLDLLVAHLKNNPTSRRAVLQMWNVEDDLLKIGGLGNRIRCQRCRGSCFVPDGPDDNSKPCPNCYGPNVPLVSKRWIDEPASRDVCCNLSVMFSIREVNAGITLTSMPPEQVKYRYLDMTVTNRSNDLIWGLLGSNYVHFSILQEYMAARLGVEVGLYHHFTNNLHSYISTNSGFHPEKWLSDLEDDIYQYGDQGYGAIHTTPLVKDPAIFECAVLQLGDYYQQPQAPSPNIKEPFLDYVFRPMMYAFHCHKMKNLLMALKWASEIQSDDWRLAAIQWLERRQ